MNLYIDRNLLKKLQIILITIILIQISLEKFGGFCFYMARTFKQKYPWYQIPSQILECKNKYNYDREFLIVKIVVKTIC